MMAFALSDLQLKSTAFDFDGRIPEKHTGEGVDVSPELSWTNVPEGTQSFAVVCHDPDAPRVGQGNYGYVHWVLYNIPSSVSNLPEGAQEFTAGVNDSGKTGYKGPMPPEGHGPHSYYFMILALNEAHELEPGLTLWQLFDRIEPHVIGMNRLVGKYQRDKR